MTTTQKTPEFFAAWALYQDVIQHNYMCHREMIATLRQYQRDKISILDLGCGDAFSVREAFGDCEDIIYCGIDQSAEALTIAESGLAHESWCKHFFKLDLLKALEQLSIGFDLVIAGYSLHHLCDADKEAALNLIKATLPRDGRCLIYDLLPEPTESRDDYIQRFLRDCDTNWTRLSAEQLASIREHVESKDFPVELAHWKAIAHQVGFKETTLIYRDSKKHYGLLELI